MVDFDAKTTAAVFVAVIVVAAGGLVLMDVMQTSTILTMVLPSMVVFGLLCLAIGVKYGEHRVTGGTSSGGGL